MNILFIHSQGDMREALSFALEGKLAVKAQTAENAASAKTGLWTFIPDMIILENNPENIEKMNVLSKEFTLACELILCSANKTDKAPPLDGMKVIAVVGPDNIVDTILALVKPRVEEKAKNQPKEESEESQIESGFCRINTTLLLRFNPLDADIYIRLSSSKFLRLFSKNDVFDANDLKRYRDEKGIDYLFMRNEDSGVFVNKLLKELDKMLMANPPASPLSAADTLGNAVETIHSLLHRVGATEPVQKAVKGTVDAALKSLGEFPEMGNILKTMKDHHGKYIGHHSMLLSSLACAIAVELDWYSDATFEKLTMAAMMHDSSLQSDELCAVKNLGEFDKKYKGKFKLADIQVYKSHPDRSATLLNTFKDLPAEVSKIVAQHHEHPMGTGFPTGATANYITPLSSLFIVAHDLADHMIDNKGAVDLDAFLEENEKKYSQGNFKKIAKALAGMDLG